MSPSMKEFMSKYMVYFKGGPFNGVFRSMDETPAQLRVRVYEETTGKAKVRVKAAVYSLLTAPGDDDIIGGRTQRAYEFHSFGEFLPSLTKDFTDVF